MKRMAALMMILCVSLVGTNSAQAFAWGWAALIGGEVALEFAGPYIKDYGPVVIDQASRSGAEATEAVVKFGSKAKVLATEMRRKG